MSNTHCVTMCWVYFRLGTTLLLQYKEERLIMHFLYVQVGSHLEIFSVGGGGGLPRGEALSWYSGGYLMKK